MTDSPNPSSANHDELDEFVSEQLADPEFARAYVRRQNETIQRVQRESDGWKRLVDIYERRLPSVTLEHFRREHEPCDLCGKPASGLAYWDEKRLCHGDFDPEPSCYERVSGAAIKASRKIPWGSSDAR